MFDLLGNSLKEFTFEGETFQVKDPLLSDFYEYEKAQKSKNSPEKVKADAKFLSAILYKDGDRVISEDKIPELIKCFSFKHSKLLNAAFSAVFKAEEGLEKK